MTARSGQARRVIDVHGHLGDVLFPGGGEIVMRTGVRRPRFEFIRVMDRLNIHAPWFVKAFFAIVHRVGPGEKLLTWLVGRSDAARNRSATLENLSAELDRHRVDHFVALPIAPNVLFDDVLAAATADPRVIPFTTVDFDDLANVEQRLADDVARGARGLKLHPILQRVALDAEETATAVRAFAPHGLPVLFHAGYCNYYDGCPQHRHLEAPENGYIATAVDLIRAFPDVRFVVAHGALDETDDLVSLLGDAANVWVDVSFQEPAAIVRLIDVFGADRVMYAADFPYGGMPLSLHRVERAVGHDADLLDRVLYGNAAELLGLD